MTTIAEVTTRAAAVLSPDASPRAVAQTPDRLDAGAQSVGTPIDGDIVLRAVPAPSYPHR